MPVTFLEYVLIMFLIIFIFFLLGFVFVYNIHIESGYRPFENKKNFKAWLIESTIFIPFIVVLFVELIKYKLGKKE